MNIEAHMLAALRGAPIRTALPEHMAIYEIMKDYGLSPDIETANTARRTEGSFAGIGNVIFYRK